MDSYVQFVVFVQISNRHHKPSQHGPNRTPATAQRQSSNPTGTIFMGRRALPKVSEQLDLSATLHELADLKLPFDPADWFQQTGPLEIEVGSGKGLFISNAAQDHPERNFIGIEIARKYARFCASRIAKRELSNAVMISGDGERFLREFIASDSVSAVHVYFPDPWWKKRHRKRRVLNATFLQDVERVLVSSGQLHFWTDVQEYYNATLELIRETTQLLGPLAVGEKSAEHDMDYRTHFERRTRLNQEAVYRSRFMKA